MTDARCPSVLPSFRPSVLPSFLPSFLSLSSLRPLQLLVYEAIIEACEVSAQRYPTTEDDDTLLMSDRFMFTALPVNARNAIRLRRTEKRLLKRTVASAERRMNEIKAGGQDPSVAGGEFKPWLEKKSIFDNIIDEIGVDLK
jgi:hypothetical protein